MREAFSATLAAILLFVGITIVWGAWFTVGQDERGVLTRWGAIVEENIEPGLHWKTPWVNGVDTITVATQRNVYEGMEGYSRDQQPAHFRISVNWHIPADKVGEVFWRYGGEQGLVDRLLDRHVPQQSKTVFGKFNAITLIQERNRFDKELYDSLVASTAGEPIVIESVQTEDVQFSADYIAAVKARMIAEVEVQKMRQQEEQQKVQADIVVIKANAEAEAKVAQATAEAKAIELRGKAVADALNLKGQALASNPRLVDMAIAEKWSGALPTQMIPGAALPILDITQKPVPVNPVKTVPVPAPDAP